MPCNFLIIEAICPYHYTITSTVWHTSIGMNVFTWFWLLLRSFALLRGKPFSFQFSRILFFFWQVIWYPCSRVISNAEPSGCYLNEVWMRCGDGHSLYRALIRIRNSLWPPCADLHDLHLHWLAVTYKVKKQYKYIYTQEHKNTIH